MLPNQLYFWNKKTQIGFFFHFDQHLNLLKWMALFYVDLDHGIHCNRCKVARNENMNKKIGFSYSKNMANFEIFLQTFSSSTNPEIVRCDIYIHICYCTIFSILRAMCSFFNQAVLAERNEYLKIYLEIDVLFSFQKRISEFLFCIVIPYNFIRGIEVKFHSYICRYLFR